ncbi:hypothetical protein C7B82_05380 [Stenomitos frigidus ULC18]|uniref:Uncharacterized protein n=1 Tax=Stenomitos frigidus ULC18 TaxID=2107698 RepID=A0A2T1EI67_9CYAN|nr:hypothetical protein C7B82_05380 [Stenomitos frigidus ULC18]
MQHYLTEIQETTFDESRRTDDSQYTPGETSAGSVFVTPIPADMVDLCEHPSYAILQTDVPLQLASDDDRDGDRTVRGIGA